MMIDFSDMLVGALIGAALVLAGLAVYEDVRSYTHIYRCDVNLVGSHRKVEVRRAELESDSSHIVVKLTDGRPIYIRRELANNCERIDS